MTGSDNSNIARTMVGGSLYSVAASGVTITLGFIRAVLMARLLLPEHFGVTTLALFYMNLASQFRALGVDSALIHRKDADDDVMATYFTIRLGQVAISTIVVIALIPLLGRLHGDIPLLPTVLLAYTAISVVKGLNSIQTTVLSKRLAFRPLAITDVISSVTMTVVGPLLAWMGFGVWSIVAELASGILSRTISIWIVYRAWRPRLGWHRHSARWFWNYGSRLWAGNNLAFLLDRFDDWWIGTFLGSSPLGFYSRAYEFAGYPRRVIANPILSVFFPGFAQLQDDRQRLSRAFFRPTSLMIRAGGLFSLVAAFLAPKFVRIFLGEQWIPMIVTFQLMIIYTLLDPLQAAASNLLAATGHPGQILRARILQALLFVPAVLLLGSQLGIEGVALAANIMIATGALFLFLQTKRVVDYSWPTLWLWPLAAVMFTAILVIMLNPLWTSLQIWYALLAKLLLIVPTYVVILWLTERRQLLSGWRMIWGLARTLLRRT